MRATHSNWHRVNDLLAQRQVRALSPLQNGELSRGWTALIEITCGRGGALEDDQQRMREAVGSYPKAIPCPTLRPAARRLGQWT